MKSGLTLIILIVVCFLFETKAQTAQGSFMVGGSMTLQRHARQNPDATFSGTLPQGSFSINPNVGFFVVNNLMIGIQPSYSYTWSLHSSTKGKQFGIGPVARYYFRIGKFAIFPEVSASLNRASNTGQYYDGVTQEPIIITLNQDTKTYRSGLGGTWFPSANIGIEGIVYYRSSTFTGDSSSNRKLSRIGATFAIQFYFPRKG